MKKQLLFIISLLVITFANAQVAGDYRSAVTIGNWSNYTSWERYDGAAWVPALSAETPGIAVGAAVLIRDGHTITYDAAATNPLGSLTVGEGTSGTLDIGGFDITVTGTTNITAGGTLYVTATAGTKTFGGAFTNNGTWSNTGNSAITFGGDITNNATFTAGTGAYSLTGTGAAINGTLTLGTAIHSGSYTNNGTFTISTAYTINTVTTFTNASVFTSSTAITVTGTFTNNATATVNGTTFGGAGTFTNAATGTLNIGTAGVGITTLTTSAAGNTVNYTGASGQVLRGQNYANLGVALVSGTATLSLATTATTLTITSGTLNLGTIQLTATNTVVNGGALGINGATTIKALGATTINSGGAINLTAGATVTATSLTINTGGTWSSATTAAAVTISSDLTNSGTFTNSVATTYSIAGNLTNDGTFTAGAGIYTLTGASKNISTTSTALTIPSVTIPAVANYSVSANFTASNPFTVSTALLLSTATSSLTNNGVISSPSVTITAAGGTFTNNGTLSITSSAGILSGSGSFINTATGTLNFAGTAAPLVTTFTTTAAGNTVTYNGVSGQIVRGATYSNLNFAIASGTGTLSAATTATTLTITSGTLNLAAIQLTATNTIVNSGALGINGATTTKALGATTINSGGAINITAGATVTASSLTINTGGTWSSATTIAGVTISGDLTNSGTFTNSIATTYSIGGNLTNDGTFTSFTGLYTLTGAAKTISTTSTALTIASVTVSGSYTVSANFTNTNAFTVSTALIVSAATSSLTNSGFINTPSSTISTAGGALNNNGTLNITGTGGVLSGSGSFVNGATGTLNHFANAAPAVVTFTATAVGNTVAYKGTAGQAVRGTTYHHLIINPSTGITCTLAAAATVNGNFTILTGLFADNNNAITGNSGNTFTLSAGTTYTTIKTVAPFVPSNYTSFSIDPTSTFNYNGAAAHNLPAIPITYGHLSISGGAFAKTLASTITCNNLLIATTSSLASGAFNITVNGNLNFAGTGAFSGTGKIILSGGSAAHTITMGTGTISQLELSDAQGATMLSALTLSGQLTLTSGAFAIGANTLTANGAIVATSGTFTGGTTSNLTLGSTGVASTLPAISGGLGTLSISRTGAATTTLSANITVATSLVIAASNILADGGFTLTVNGSITNNGTHSGTGKIMVSGGSGAHTITGSLAANYSILEINDGGFATTLTNSGASTNTTIATLTISSGVLNVGAMIGSGSSAGLVVTGMTTIGNGTNTASLVYFASGGNRTFGTGAVGGITINNNGTFNLGTGSQGPGNTSIANIIVNNGGNWNNAGGYGMNPINGSITVNGSFTSGSGLYSVAGTTQTINGTLTITNFSCASSNTYTNLGNLTILSTFSGGTFTNGANSTLNLSVVPVGTLVATAVPNLVRYFGASGYTIKGTTYHNLTIDMNSAAVTATAPTGVVVNNDFIVNAGTFADGGFQITGNSAGVFNVNAGATYTTTRTTTPWFPTAYTSVTLASTSTWNYNGAASFSIPTTPITAYGHLGIGGGAFTKTLAANTSCNNLATASTNILATAAFTLTATGNISNTGSITSTGVGELLLNGGTIHAITGAGPITNLELNDAAGATVSAGFSILGVLTQTAGTLTINAGQTLTLGAGSSLAATGSGNFGGTTTSGLTITGTGALGNTLRFAGGAQNLALLTLNRTTSGVVNMGSDLTLNAATGLTLTNGLLFLGSNSITFAVGSFAGAGSATAMVVADGSGELRKAFNTGATGIFTFPIGDVSGSVGVAPNNNNTGADFSPVAITMTANNTPRTIGVRVTDAQSSNDVSTTNVISRYWNFSDTQAGTGNYTYTGTFTYSTTAPSDLTGTQNLMSLNRWNGSAWTQLNTTYPANGFTITGATETTGTLGGNEFTARINPAITYTWQGPGYTSGNAISGVYTTATNWSPARTITHPSDILRFTLGGTITVTGVPSETIGTLIIGTSSVANDVTFNSTGATQILNINGVSGNTFDIQPTSTLRLSSSATTRITFGSTGTNATNIAGTLELATTSNNSIDFTYLLAANNTITGTIRNKSGTVTATTLTTRFASGSNYIHDMGGGAIPAATWDANSTCTISGATTPATFAATGAGAFGNLTIDVNGGNTATLSGVTTVNGNLTVTSGTFSDGSFQITGNASGTLSVANAATLQIGTAFTGTFIPTAFVTSGNITLSTGSTVIFGSSSAQNVAGLTYHHLTLTSSGAKTFLAAPTINGNLAITGCQVNDAGFQITGNATGTFNMSAAAGSILVLGTTTVSTAFPTNFIAGNISLGAGSTVRYNSNLNQNISNVPTYAILALTGGAANTKTLLGNTAIAMTTTGALSISASNTLNLGGYTLTITATGAGVSPISNTSGTISANTDGGSTIVLAGSAALNIAPGTITPTARFNLTASNSSGITQGVAFNVFNFNITTGTYTLQAGGILGIAGTYANSGTLAANNGATAGLNFNSTATTQTFTVGTYTGSNLGLLQISNTGGGVSLGSALNVTQLTLTNGILTTTGTFLLTVSGTSGGNVSGGSTTSYVNGPLVRSLPASASGNTYTFPVGKANFNTFDLLNPTTTLATTVRVEVFDATAGGTDGLGFSSSPTPNRYWQASVPSGALTSSGTIRLLDASVTVDANTVVGNAATITGTYNPLGGTNPNSPSSGYITSTSTAPNALGFFKMGSRGCLSGTYTVGATGQFTKITNAVSTLNGSQVCGDIIFELQSNYDGTTGETFPITINALNYSGGPWNVTFRPGTSVSTRTTSGNPGSGVNFINLNGANRIIFDGRAGGTGSTIAWLIRNTQTAATFTPTIQFSADASNNTLQYLQLESQNALTTSGTVLFTAGTTTGNDNNTISNCLFSNRGDATTTFPANHIYAVASTSGKENSNISITNNNFRNFYINGNTSSGITIDAYNTDYNITGNSFYQTGTLTPTTSTTLQYGISVSGTGTGDINIANNFIGGNAAGATGTWTATASSTIDYRFCGIFLSNTVALPASLIDGNTIRNFTINTGSVFQTQAGVFSGIYSQNVGGTISNNIIGSTGAASNIGLTFTGASALGVVQGIFQDGNGVINITGNTVGGISLANSTSNAIIYNLHGIRASTSSTGSTVTITGNTIGSTTIANSLTNATGNTYNSTGNIFTTGIFCDAGNTGSTTNISNNTIANLSYTAGGNGTTGSVQVVGIYRQFAPANTISSNTIYNLSSTSPYIGTNASASVGGIVLLTTLASNHTVSQNTIHSLSNTTASAAVTVTGIALNTTTTANTVTRNLIHSLSLSSSSTSAVINGIAAVAGNSNYSNNMIRLGVNAAGSSITVGYAINGINEVAGTNNFYSNSIYIGGTGVASSASPTYALLSAGTGTRAIQNNIFWNARSNAAGTAKHYAIRYATATGLTSSYNDLLATGTGAVLGNIGGVDNSTLSALSTNSISSDPMFINPTGDNGIVTPGTNDVDLHIQPSPVGTPIEGIGVATPATLDFDGQTRTSFTAEDMGADAGNFTPVDLTAPTITYTAFGGACNTIGTGTYNVGSVTITDASGVNTTAGTKPRIYYKKQSDASTTFNDNTSGTAGWKFVEANGTTSPFNFDINFALLSGGAGAIAGDVIQYFIVAQDQGPNVPATPNVAINSGTFNATPTSVALTSAAFPIGGTPNIFSILPCQGTVTVGTTSANYNSLTNTGGIFEVINATTLTGNLTVNITTDLTSESGTVALTQWAESGAGNYRVKFQSSASATRTISGSYNGAAIASNGLVRLNGADRVTFNGGTGSQRFLTFQNNHTLTGNFSSAISLLNDASNDSIKNCNINATVTSGVNNGVVYIGGATTTGNDNNVITNNTIADINNGTNFPNTGIYAIGTGSAINDNLVISNNNIANVYTNGTVSYGVRIETLNGATTIQGNSLYQTATRNPGLSGTELYGIYTNTTSGVVTISGNFIGGSGASASGALQLSPSPTSPSTTRFVGIWQNTAATAGNSIGTNTINNIVLQSSSGAATNYGVFSGIYVVAGNATINANQIGDNTVNASSAPTLNIRSNSNGAGMYGIRNIGTGTLQITNNNIGGLQVSNATSAGANTGVLAHGISSTAGVVTITGNTVGSTTTASNISLSGINATTNPVTLYGIAVTTSTNYNATIQNNTIQNISNGGLTSTGVTGAILVSTSGTTSQINVSNNTIATITGAGTQSTTGVGAVMFGIGISASSSTAQTTVSNNTIYDLICNGGGSPGAAIGITYLTGSNANNVINANNIHSFNHSSFGAGANHIGIEIVSATGTVRASNNFIRLGRTAAGASFNSSMVLTGILDASTNAQTYAFNTIFIDGAPSGGSAQNSYAFRRSAASGADVVRNNILANNRSGGPSGSLHFAFASNTLSNYTAANFNYNIFYAASNTEFSVALTPANLSAASTTALRLQAFRANSSLGTNLNSGIATLSQINFVNATGDATALDLRLNNANCASGAGIAVSGVTSDYFGTITRSSTAPAIGAHEGSTFSSLSADNDIYSPNFSFTNIPTQSACGGSSTTNVDVTITDIGTAVPTTGSSVPVMWWRRSSGTPTAWAPVQGVLQSGNGNSGVFRFSITNTYAVGETYQYYFVADDQATNQALNTPGVNRWYSSYDATTPVVNLTTQTTQPATVSSFATNATAPLTGIKTVGTSGDYATFNGNTSSAFFYDLSQKGIGSNLTVKVISDVNELANYWPLTAPTELCGSNYTITIRPDTNILRTVASNTFGSNPLIELNGVKRVIIDGRNSGSGSYLRFRQASTQTTIPPTFYFVGNAQNITIQYCTIEGNNNQLTTATTIGAGVVNFAGPLGSGLAIKDITLDNNIIRNRSDLTQSSANTPYSLVQMGQSNGTSTPVKSRIVISNNELLNFKESAIQVRQNTSFAGIGDSIIITGNKVYMPIAMPTYTYPIWLEGGTNTKKHVISNNIIGGNAAPNPGLNGTWSNSLTDGEIVGIYTLNGGTSLADGINISGNTIGNMTLTGTTYTNLIGIRNEFGYATIQNNTITTMNNNGGGSVAVTDNTANIGIWNQDDNEVLIDGNTITNWTTLGITTRFLYMIGIEHGSNQYHNGVDYTNNPGGKATVTNNTISNLYCGSGLQSVTLSPDALIGIFVFPANGSTGNSVSGNTISGLRATLTNVYNTRVYGIGVGLGGYGATCTGSVSKNKIYDLNNTGGGTSTEINGMVTAGGNWTVSNNMVSITNSVYPTKYPSITGILDWMANGRTGAFYNNSVYIGGTVASPGANSSYAYCRIPDGTATVLGANLTIRNNLFFNDRSGNSTNNMAIGNLTTGNSADAATGWNSNYNLLLARDANMIGRWIGTPANNKSFPNWLSSSSGDGNSWSVVTTTSSSSNTQVNASDLFNNTTTGDLTIKTANQAAWFVNGKGVSGSQVGSLATDYNGTTRGTTYGYGIDIGADEFDVDNGNIPHTLTGTPTSGGTTTFNFAGRTVASVDWGSGGTVPTSVSCTYYSGNDPGSVGTAYLATNKANFVYEITASGGSGFTYAANLNYDPALLGTYAASESTMRLVKTRNNWFDEHSSLNTTTKVMSSVNTLNSFSWFTGGQANEPLPITLLTFTAKPVDKHVDLHWVTASEINNDYFTVERSLDAVHFEPISIIQGAGNSNTTLTYTDIDVQPYDGLSYYRLKQTDFDGQYSYSDIRPVLFSNSTFGIVRSYVNSDGQIELWVNNSANEQSSLSILDIQGKLIGTQNQELTKGINKIVFANSVAQGIYLIRVQTSTNDATVKILK